jgi:ABC-type uncharacterized transport system involved in gliding motility auxiliary subunit
MNVFVDKFLKLFIYIVIIVLINLVGATLFFRFDLTENKLYTISAASRKVVKTLSEPLTVNVFFTKDLPAPYNQTENYLHDMLAEYARNANEYFNYQFFDVDPESEGLSSKTQANREIANNYGIHPVQIQMIENDEVKFINAYMGIVIIHGDQIERIPAITSTEGLEYKMTTAFQKLNNKVSALLNLKEKVEITLYLSSTLKLVAPYMGLEDLFEYPRELKKIIEKLSLKTYGKLQYKYIDPAIEKIPAAELQKYQLTTLKWPAVEAENIKPGTGVIGLVMSYGDKALKLPLLKILRLPIIGVQYNLTEISQLEELVNDNLELLVDINKKLGFLADYGALNLSSGSMSMGRALPPQSTTRLSKLLSDNYSLEPVHLKDNGVPEGLKCLIIAHPVEKFSDHDLWQIDQALMRGTNLMLFPDPFHEVKPPPGRQRFGMQQELMYIPLDTGLEKLLAHWGIKVKKALTMDKHCFKQRLQHFGGGETELYFAPVIENKNINHGLSFMNNIKGLVTVKIAPLELNKKQIEKHKLTAKRLFSSSAKSWEMRGQINLNPMFIRPPTSEEEFSSMPLAYLLEGEFQSYFKEKPIPEKPIGNEAQKDQSGEEETSKLEDVKLKTDLSQIESQGNLLEKSPPVKIFIMASSEMLKDSVIDSEGQSPNAMFILNAIDELNGRTAIAVMRSKVQRFNPLEETSPESKTMTKAFNIAGLPILTVIFGLFIWMRRHARKTKIQRLFP